MGFTAMSSWAVIPLFPLKTNQQRTTSSRRAKHDLATVNINTTSLRPIRTWRNPAPKQSQQPQLETKAGQPTDRASPPIERKGKKLTAQAQDYCTTFFSFYFFLD
jgi:hypothetical protein